MTFNRIARSAIGALCLSLVASTAGCTAMKTVVFGEQFEFHCPRPTAPGLALAVGARASSPAPKLPAEVRQLVVDTMNGCGRITVVRIDGRPAVVGQLGFSTGARTQQNLDMDKANFLKRVNTVIADAKAVVPEANVLAALTVASDAAGRGGTVVLVDSGVQTTAPLDFRKHDLPSRRPGAVVDALKQQRLLPNLAGRKVVMAGIGYTAPPQQALDAKNQAFLVELWRGIVIAAGAKDPVVAEEPNTSDAAVASPPVSVVHFPVAEITLGCDTLSVLPDSGAVGFVPGQADFRDPAAAGRVLAPFVDFLHSNPTASVSIKGYVAHYGAGDLSKRRAYRVKNELTARGATNTIVAEGMGWGPYPTVNAPPDPRYDQKNRQVTIEVRCH